MNSLAPTRACGSFTARRSNRPQQRGFGTLTVALILLFAMSLLAVFVNKGLIFEQQASANQYRATKAFEAAEAGLEWATAMLNNPGKIDASCTPGGAGATQNFREKYLAYSAASGFTPVTTAQPGCTLSVNASGLPSTSCSCPNAGVAPGLGSTTNPTFTLKFEPVNATTLPGGTPDAESVLVTAYGCTAADVRCVPGATGTADAYQKVSVILKLRPGLRSVPAAAITAGGNVDLRTPASRAVNADPTSNGFLINAGGTMIGNDLNTSGSATLPGSPLRNAIATSDTSLSTLATNPDAMFQSFFGTTIAQYKADPFTKVLTAADCGSNCETAFMAAYDAGYRAFYLEGPLQVSSGVVGSATNPVALVSSALVRFNGNTQFWGLLYGDQVDWQPNGLGSGGINGALVARGDFAPNANADYRYDPEVLKRLRGSSGAMLRVPGSWKDF